ncbi:Protein of unknown function [Pyronema omphalodes CBS 100304]|uniref:Uncharacterized protein n=1 Tax=Pyronema omphalodes (strain CBS 100304) TaxID=1076935 RepID=U4L8A4_PYROM|nr:Protein of unknown function [Pyronema omphalodes CBS 100304]
MPSTSDSNVNSEGIIP